MEEIKLTKKEKRALAKEKKRKERERKKGEKRIVNLVFALVIIGGVVFSGFKVIQWLRTPSPVPHQIVEAKDNDWIMGNPSSTITLVEYADFQCPACSSFAQQTKQLVEEYPNNIQVVFRHFPLNSIHKNALSAAKAAEAAGKQGKFWEMHDLLYERQSDWENDTNVDEKFVAYAKDLELDENKFTEDYESSEVEQKIESDLSDALSLGLNSTPSLFINGEKTNPPQNYDRFKALIEEKLAQ